MMSHPWICGVAALWMALAWHGPSQAAEKPVLLVEGDPGSYSVNTEENKLHIIGEAPLVLSMPPGVSSVPCQIRISSGTQANITLDGVTMDASEDVDACALVVSPYASLGLTLQGDNRLVSGYCRAGICVPRDAVLNVRGANDAVLHVQSGWDSAMGQGAAIGGDGGNSPDAQSVDAGEIHIHGGDLLLESGSGAGLGGGSGDRQGGDGGRIYVHGGKVRAVSYGGAGIGGGRSYVIGGNAGLLEVSGGEVSVLSYDNVGIGGGRGGSGHDGIGGDGGFLTITGGHVAAFGSSGSIGAGGGNLERDNVLLLLDGPDAILEITTGNFDALYLPKPPEGVEGKGPPSSVLINGRVEHYGGDYLDPVGGPGWGGRWEDGYWKDSSQQRKDGLLPYGDG